MRPTHLSDLRKAPDPVEQLRAALGSMVDIRAPGEAEEPILTKPVRASLLSWLREIDMAKELSAVGVKPRRSAFLFGPPGCGKTTLAHHLAARLGIPLIAARSEMLVGSHLGATGRNIAKLFDTIAATKIRAILFFDEMDAIGSMRSSDDQACSREMNAALTSLLRLVETHDGLLIAATNREDAIDQALWRRFDIHIGVDLPHHDERYGILKRYAVPYEPADELLDALTDATAGASPSQLRQLMEGIKRLLVVGPRIGFDTSSLPDVIGTVAASVSPWAGQELPPLWSNRQECLDLLPPDQWPMATGRPA